MQILIMNYQYNTLVTQKKQLNSALHMLLILSVQHTCLKTSQKSRGKYPRFLSYQYANLPVGYSYCPICLQMFPDAYIETHASVCGESTDKKAAKSDVADVDLITRSFQDEVMRIRKDAVDVWEIPVIRRLFIKTAMAEMESANKDEWLRQLKIDFIGEEGVDAGGPCREFFSLLFRNTPVFENGGFSLNSELLEKKHYMYVGRMSSLAIINGHPGPKCINNYLVNYILEGIQPECTLTQLEMISRDDVIEAIKEIDTVNADNKYDITEKYAELLDCSGFRKALNQDTKEEAVRAMQNHFIFFKWLPSLLQFIEGFKLLGVLELCRKHPTDSRKCLEPSDISYSEVMDFFKPSYSSEKEKKEKEEVIVYNFGQFLKKVERQRITSNWINLDIDEEKKDTNVSMKNVLQAFVGSEGLPTDIDFGIIEFDHQSENLSSVNTCAPSITIRQISQNQNYQTLENHLLNIIVGTDGFDMK
ncbi:uncharacterized protein LOC143053438 [Mytilus galloprovincialis]|uniref:uncharacterized protein LOC143053438 n=1 Tax=Mytilus galloprovincialis TaxID=29158 RepID=UPI003F7B4D9A